MATPQPNANQLALESTFASLTPTQKQAVGGLEGLASKVQAAQLSNIGGDRFGGGRELNFDVALGQVVGGLRQSPPNISSGQQIVSQPSFIGSTPTVSLPQVGNSLGVVTSELADRQRAEAQKRLDQARANISPDLQNILNKIPNITQGLADLDKTESDQLDFIRERSKQIGIDLESTIAGLQNRFARERTSTQTAGARAEGGTRAFIGRAGALQSASGRSAVEQQVVATQRALEELTIAENQAIQTAQNAASQENLDLLQKALGVQESVRAEKNRLQQQQFENILRSQDFISAQKERARQGALQERQFSLEEKQFAQKEQKDILDQISANPEFFKSLNPRQLADVESRLNFLVPGQLSALIDVLDRSAKATLNTEKQKADLDLIKILKDIPQDQEIELSDGTILKGLEPVESNNQTFKIKRNGVDTLVTINKLTGEEINSITVPSLSPVSGVRVVTGKSSSIVGDISGTGVDGREIDPDLLAAAKAVNSGTPLSTFGTKNALKIQVIADQLKADAEKIPVEEQRSLALEALRAGTKANEAPSKTIQDLRDAGFDETVIKESLQKNLEFIKQDTGEDLGFFSRLFF